MSLSGDGRKEGAEDQQKRTGERSFLYLHPSGAMFFFLFTVIDDMVFTLISPCYYRRPLLNKGADSSHLRNNPNQQHNRMSR